MAIIDNHFKEMSDKGASDLHMMVGFPPLIRLRGELVPLEQPILTAESNQEILYEILGPVQRSVLEKQKDFDMAYELRDVGRFRCNFLYQHRGVGAVFRIIPTEILTLEQLKLPEAVCKICEISRGMVLVTGPTGSGKSTTLAAIIDHINKTQSKHHYSSNHRSTSIPIKIIQRRSLEQSRSYPQALKKCLASTDLKNIWEKFGEYSQRLCRRGFA